jgi:pimeloyl-ACP methyl ester carboxylesterase
MPYANNNGVKIHYEVEGERPPLVLAHALMSSQVTRPGRHRRRPEGF